MSTAMAIAIVLAIFVSLLVTVATLNITTTQATVSQREAYIQAKSALSFAESYYNNNISKLPGYEGLMVFKDEDIASGADVYITKSDETTETIDSALVQALRNEAASTYIDVVNTGGVLRLTAYCKYGADNMYSLSKEFNLIAGSGAAGNPWKGNITYTVSNDTRYLRIHVRTSPAFEGEPYLYAWWNEVNVVNEESRTGTENGTSSIVNKLLGSSAYPSKNTGNWDGDNGPTKAMEYEGNGWYVLEIQLGTNENVNSVNMIVTRKGANRLSSGDSQTWEYFGVPVPTQAGVENGTDVYFTLNDDNLLDKRQGVGAANPFDGKDELTNDFRTKGLNGFAEYCAEYYSVYTKRNMGTIHVRYAGNYEDNGKGDGTDAVYEGYGWYRYTSYNLSDTVDGHTYDEGRTISSNTYNSNREVVKELFICKTDSGATETFGTEEEANAWFVSNGDTKAGDYVTVNVRSNSQPVDATVGTTINYDYEWIETVAVMPTPGDVSSDSDSDTDGDPTTDMVSFTNGSEPTVMPMKVAKTDVQKLGTAADIQLSGATDMGRYSIIGTMTGWDTNYENTLDMTSNGDGTYSYTFENLESGEHRYKIVERTGDTGTVNWDTTWGADGKQAGSSDITFEVSETSNVTITFDATQGLVTSTEIVPVGGGDSDTETDTTTDTDSEPSTGYAVVGWLNDWGRLDGVNHVYEGTTDMTFIGANQYQLKVHNVAGGQTVSFKVIEKAAGATGAIDWSRSWGGTGADGNYDYKLNGDSLTYYTMTIVFTVNGHSINVTVVEEAAPAEYYLYGDFTSTSAEQVKSYSMTESGTDEDGNTYYEYNVGPKPAGSYNIRVLSNDSFADDGSIDLTKSWGDADADGTTYGSGNDLKIDLTAASTVVVRFTVDKDDATKSKITYNATPYTHHTGTLKKVAFCNAQIENVNNHSKTDFTTPWDKVYVNYTDENLLMASVEVTHVTDGKFYWADVPENAEHIYFSNGPAANKGTPGYEYTENILNADFKDIKNPVFFPISSSDTSDGKMWSFGDTEDYRIYLSSVKTATNVESTMVYTGSNKVSYYDIPIVNLLKQLVDGGSGNYVFSSKIHKDYELPDHSGKKYTFNKDTYVTYQNEKYYYVASKDGNSYFIANEGDGKGVVLYEGEFSAETKFWGGVEEKMYNRAGGAYTSTGEYYDGSTSNGLDYGGYSPSWYTFKIPTSSTYKINNVKGVESAGADIGASSSTLTPVKADTYYNQPVYIYKDGSDTEVYTYDIDTGRVDTSKDSKVSVYFNKPSSWSGNVKCYAYGFSGSTFDNTVSIDATSADTSYYKFTFDEGKYAYFVFYDGNENRDTTTKKTGILYLTGEENENREYKILADGQTDEFTWYLHPKTKALYAFQEARSAYYGSGTYKSYTYNSTDKKYTGKDFTYMSALESKMNSAKTYMESGSSGKWSSSASASYSDLATAAVNFTNAITHARIYIAEEDPAHPSDPAYIFPEGEYRDDIISYTDRWVATLKAAYNDAMALYDNSGSQNEANFQAHANTINAIINNPETIISPDAVTVIVDDQKITTNNDDGTTTVTGGWGKSSIHIYGKSTTTGTWSSLSCSLLDTSQSADGYYAYVFRKDPDIGSYVILRGSDSDYEAAEAYPLMASKRYFFHTATGKWEEDSSTPSINISMDEITQGGANDAWAKNEPPVAGKEFILYFNYDTTVTYGSKQYTIHAGAYTINSSYPGWSTDLSSSDPSKKGIDLFTDTAKAFFENPIKYGMAPEDTSTPQSAAATSLSYAEWNSSITYAKEINIMCSSLNSSSGLEASGGPTTECKRVNFRYKNVSGSDTLSVNTNVKIKADVVTMAVNYIDLSAGGSFILDTQSVTFFTDTVVKLPDGTTYKITHGKWAFNAGASGGTTTIDLSNSDWMKYYTLLGSTGTNLSGGTYVSKNY